MGLSRIPAVSDVRHLRSSARSEIVHAACATTLIGTRRTMASLCTIPTGFRRMFSLSSSRRITSRLSSASSTSTTSGRCHTIRCAVPPAAVSASPGADVGGGERKSRCRCGRGRAQVPVQMWAGALFFRSITLTPEPEWSVCFERECADAGRNTAHCIAAAHGHAALQRESNAVQRATPRPRALHAYMGARITHSVVIA